MSEKILIVDDERIYEPLTEMLNAAKIQGLEPIVVSGYRTTSEQKEIMAGKINEFCRAGISEEVWHYRYVGKDAAEEIYKRNLCLEEYLEEIEIS